jgi:NADPH-dependent curcumin reductase CurA
MSNTSFLVHKNNLFETSFSETEKPELDKGEALLKIEKYAFTSNNITYAVVGHQVGYWNFFPATEPNGIVPVWGFAKVVESNEDSVQVGERVYGYFPMSTYLKVKPAKQSIRGFVDNSEHRQALPPIYNYLSYVQSNIPGEDFMPIIQPLFTTGFLSYHFLKQSNFFDAKQVILTSASSKTALGLAYFLNQNQADDGLQIIGLTSQRNIDFVKGTGFYDSVISYEDVTKELSKSPAVMVDFVGNAELAKTIDGYLVDDLKFISRIGLTNWKSGDGFNDIPKAKFFFAPDFIKKIYEKWGVGKTTEMVQTALSDFIKIASNWMKIEYIETNENLSNLYKKMLKGDVNPSIGYLVKLKE